MLRLNPDLETLEIIRRGRLNFSNAICEASLDKTDTVLSNLRLESMYEFAEFYFVIYASDLIEPGDIKILSEMHNDRIENLLLNKDEMKRRGLKKSRLLSAIITSDTGPRMEEIWRVSPGSIDQSNLCRFLMPQMSAETTRKLVIACTKAGFLNTKKIDQGIIIVSTNNIMEKLFSSSLEKIRTSIYQLSKKEAQCD